MAPAFDLVLRGGAMVDGTGAAPFVADVAVKDGPAAAARLFAGRGAEETTPSADEMTAARRVFEAGAAGHLRSPKPQPAD